MFRDELDAIAAARLAHVVYLLGDDRGLLSTASLTRLVPDVDERDDHLGGPPGTPDAARRALLAGRVPVSRWHEERFAF